MWILYNSWVSGMKSRCWKYVTLSNFFKNFSSFLLPVQKVKVSVGLEHIRPMFESVPFKHHVDVLAVREHYHRANARLPDISWGSGSTPAVIDSRLISSVDGVLHSTVHALLFSGGDDWVQDLVRCAVSLECTTSLSLRRVQKCGFSSLSSNSPLLHPGGLL